MPHQLIIDEPGWVAKTPQNRTVKTAQLHQITNRASTMKNDTAILDQMLSLQR